MEQLEEFNSNRLALSTHLENLINENSDLHVEWVMNESTINGRVEDFSYFAIKAHPKEKGWVQRFLAEFSPIYEKLSLYVDYYQLRNEALHQDSYNAAELQGLYKDFAKSGEELLQNKRERTEIIQSLDPLELDRKGISKDQLLYLAKNTPSTWEVFDVLKVKMHNNPYLFPITSSETTKEIAEYFNKIEGTLDKIFLPIKTEQDELIVLSLTDMVIDFYADLKGLLDALKGKRVKVR